MKPLTIRMRADDVAEVMLYGVIGADFFGDGVSAKDFRTQIKAIKSKAINLRINSPGGSAIEASAMLSALDEHPARIEVDVDGIAASAASMVAMAGDVIRVASNGLLMIHDPYSMAMGGADDMRRMADLLDKVKVQILDRYFMKAKEKSSREQIASWMTAETWFTANEAIEAGLADEQTGAVAVAALAMHAPVLAKAKFKHAPTLRVEQARAEAEAWEETRKRKQVAAALGGAAAEPFRA